MIKKIFNMDREKSLLLVIDIQEKLSNSMIKDDFDKMLKNTKILINGINILNIPIIQSLQYKKGLGESVKNLFEENIKKMDFEKRVFSCCYENSELLNFLYKNNHITQIIIAGMESHICVLQTARDLINLKFDCVIVNDCVISRDKENKQNALNLMQSFGANIINSESILFDLLKTSLANEFKAISNLIK